MSYRAKTFEDALKEIRDDIRATVGTGETTYTSDDGLRRDLVDRIYEKAVNALNRD